MSEHELTMRAALVPAYGDPSVVTVGNVTRPTPAPGELLVRVKAASVSSGDARVRARRVPSGMGFLMRLALGWNAPRNPVLGTECAGVVEAVGADVTRFRVGDAVIVFRGAAMGAHAEYVCVRDDGPVAPKPAQLSWEESAALLFGGTTAMHYVRHGARVQRGERVLVVGASGAVGVAVVQLAHLDGAVVTAVCSAANADLARSLGASRVIDYTRDDFASGTETWDVIVDCVGNAPYARSRRALAPGGRLVRIVCGLGGQIASLWQGRRAGHRVIAGVAAERPEDVRALADLAAKGAYRAVLDATLPLERAAEAHARVDSGHKRGSVVLTLA